MAEHIFAQKGIQGLTSLITDAPTLIDKAGDYLGEKYDSWFGTKKEKVPAVVYRKGGVPLNKKPKRKKARKTKPKKLKSRRLKRKYR